MLWFADIAGGIDPRTPQIINDSKTPSGRVHVGALRGVLLHDAVFRALKTRGVPVRYLFGVDDYDPLDELPAGQKEFFEPYLGAPLCNVPAPEGSKATDMAEHFISEFFDVFRELGVHAETYRMRDHYRSGNFNEAIDRILSNAAIVRKVYKDVSGSVRSEHWHPFQVVCETCGRIGTTEVTSYDGKEVEYACKPNLVKWAKGCGNRGKISPFDGKGKLPWKLEWVAKWQALGITIEGAGKDHTTKGGSRDVAAACFEQIFGGVAPLNIPYEFFLVGGAKMSSSKGIGASARDMADFLPPEVLRFLILRTQPKTIVNFSTDEEFMVKLFNDFDRLHKRTFSDPAAREDEKELYHLCEIDKEGDFYDCNLQLLLTFIQMPHVNLQAEMEKRKGSALNEVEKKHLDRRARAARHWLDSFASPEDRMTLQETLPARAAELSHTQRAFLLKMAEELPQVPWEDDALQAKIFDVARRTPIAQSAAFKAVYRVLLDKEMGPRAGALMAVLDRDFVQKRFAEVTFDEDAFLKETTTTLSEVELWVEKERAKIKDLWAHQRGEGVGELHVKQHDDKTYVHRVEHSAVGDLLAKIKDRLKGA
ncbi:MAG: lysine--tRNA ligase [Byssovorax sp.]